MKLYLPDQELLHKTSYMDGYFLCYQFPIKYILRLRFRAILKLMGNDEFYNLLEVGTGSGLFLPELSKRCSNLYAIDTHKNFDKVEHFCKESSIDIQLSESSIEKTSFADGMFDAIVAVSVFEFVADLNKAFIEMNRILKPGGIIYTICPQPGALYDKILSYFLPPKAIVSGPRYIVSPMLEKYFSIVKKIIFPPLIGRVFPVYFFYKLSTNKE